MVSLASYSCRILPLTFNTPYMRLYRMYVTIADMIVRVTNERSQYETINPCLAINFRILCRQPALFPIVLRRNNQLLIKESCSLARPLIAEGSRPHLSFFCDDARIAE